MAPKKQNVSFTATKKVKEPTDVKIQDQDWHEGFVRGREICQQEGPCEFQGNAQTVVGEGQTLTRGLMRRGLVWEAEPL